MSSFSLLSWCVYIFFQLCNFSQVDMFLIIHSPCIGLIMPGKKTEVEMCEKHQEKPSKDVMCH